MTTAPLKSPNFYFLADHDPQLLEYAARAERYVIDDPNTTLIKLRQLAESLAEFAAGYDGMQLLPEDGFGEILYRLRREDVITQEMANIFHGLRKIGNEAAHEGRGTRQDAVSHLKLAHRLAVWFHRAYRDAAFKPQPFLLPPSLDGGGAPDLRAELERLRKARWEAERAAEVTEDALRLAEAKCAVVEAKAEELYAELVSALEQRQDPEPQAQPDTLRSDNESIVLLRAEALAASREVRAARQHQARAAARAFDLSEVDARDRIDAQLRSVGWEADSIVFTWAHRARPESGRNMAIAAVPTSVGTADYVLYCGLRVAAVLEAKRCNLDLRAALDEATPYCGAYQALADETLVPFTVGGHGIPLVFASNGQPIASDPDTFRGIWLRDLRTGKERVLHDWPTPQELTAILDTPFKKPCGAFPSG